MSNLIEIKKISKSNLKIKSKPLQMLPNKEAWMKTTQSSRKLERALRGSERAFQTDC